jgi:DNA-binding response OmpR family regulator
MESQNESVPKRSLSDQLTGREFGRCPARAARIILFSNKQSQSELVASALCRECRHKVELAELGSGRESNISDLSPDLLIIVCAMSDDSVVELCQNYRQANGMAPILVLMDEASTYDRIKILDAGADDYLLQPVNFRELTTRVENLLRRPPILYQRLLTAGHVTLDTVTGTVKNDNQEVYLRPMEYNLLEFLMQHPNQVYTSEFLWQRIWKSSSRSFSDTVRTHIKTLRMKLDKEGRPSIISTVRARGYRLETGDNNDESSSQCTAELAAAAG